MVSCCEFRRRVLEKNRASRIPSSITVERDIMLSIVKFAVIPIAGYWHSPSDDELRCARSAYTVTRSQVDSTRCVSKIAIQDSWDAYMQAHWDLCSANFWELFLAMHTYTGNAIDSALHVVKRNYIRDSEAKKKFPISRRVLLAQIRTLPPFWCQVLHTYRVDLTPFAKQLAMALGRCGKFSKNEKF